MWSTYFVINKNKSPLSPAAITRNANNRTTLCVRIVNKTTFRYSPMTVMRLPNQLRRYNQRQCFSIDSSLGNWVPTRPATRTSTRSAAKKSTPRRTRSTWRRHSTRRYFSISFCRQLFSMRDIRWKKWVASLWGILSNRRRGWGSNDRMNQTNWHYENPSEN